MNGKNILVTGASGFIGKNLVNHLVQRAAADGGSITCLVREASDLRGLDDQRVRLVRGDLVVADEQLKAAFANQDVVFHLAAKTRAIRSRELVEGNVQALRNLLETCKQMASPPTVVMVSSLAAVGPSHKGLPHKEAKVCRPISNYGRSKLGCENVAREFCQDVPVSIVRPPIVLGPYDADGLALFKSIHNTGIHFVPGFVNHHCSLIHVRDLVNALTLVAHHGNRLNVDDVTQGVWFVADNETPTVAEFGRLVGRALGRERVRVVKCGPRLVRAVGLVNSTIGRVIRRPMLLNLDKAREATAGSWCCSAEKIHRELGFAPAYSLADRISHTIHWYRQHGWLPQPSTAPAEQTEQEPGSYSIR